MRSEQKKTEVRISILLLWMGFAADSLCEGADGCCWAARLAPSLGRKQNSFSIFVPLSLKLREKEKPFNNMISVKESRHYFISGQDVVLAKKYHRNHFIFTQPRYAEKIIPRHTDFTGFPTNFMQSKPTEIHWFNVHWLQVP